MNYRNYNPDTDKAATHRIWTETGWLEKGKEDVMDLHLLCGQSLVADIEGQPECLVNRVPAELNYNGTQLSFSCIASVTTSFIARKLGYAKRLTAISIAKDADAGAAVSGLGIFDQGFYNMLGYSNGSYVNIAVFDPAQLKINIKPRIPQRFTDNDGTIIHEARLKRKKYHGSVNILSSDFTLTEFRWESNVTCLGYLENGIVTHYIIFSGKDLEYGPLRVLWVCYNTNVQLLELLALLKNLGDQIRLIRIKEPPDFHIQDWLDAPFMNYNIREKGKFESYIKAYAYWQMRICDLNKCIDAVHISQPAFSFNLQLTDPIEQYLDGSTKWHGCTGDYLVTLGESSEVKLGLNPKLPTLKASINTFTRLWLGVLPASSLSMFEDFSAPPELIAQLDEAFNLPKPYPDWDF